MTVIDDVLRERQRQESLHAPDTCANPNMDGADKLVVLVEEVGEVARAWNEGDLPGHELRTELIHVAAVAIAWAESIDSELGAAA